MSIKGQFSVALEGNTYHNMAKNGNFANGTTGWVPNTANLAVSNNVLTITGNGGGPIASARKSVEGTSIVAGRKYYIRIKAKVTNSSCLALKLWLSTNVLAKNVSTPINGNQYIMDNVVTATSDASTVLLIIESQYTDAATANGKITEIMEVMLIDLTAYGLDTLTVEQCNQRFPNWFDGTKSTLSIGNTLRTVNL